jgi:glycosyltransferase involved in cell wall biosynthesis
VAELGATNVHILGPVFGEAKRTLLLGSDALVSLSLKENFGFAVAEAVVGGLPVIVSPGVDLASELEPLGCGWFLRSLARGECETALRALVAASPEDLREMGDRGRRWALRALSEEQFGARIAALVAATARSRAPGASGQ